MSILFAEFLSQVSLSTVFYRTLNHTLIFSALNGYLKNVNDSVNVLRVFHEIANEYLINYTLNIEDRCPIIGHDEKVMQSHVHTLDILISLCSSITITIDCDGKIISGNGSENTKLTLRFTCNTLRPNPVHKINVQFQAKEESSNSNEFITPIIITRSPSISWIRDTKHFPCVVERLHKHFHSTEDALSPLFLDLLMFLLIFMTVIMLSFVAREKGRQVLKRKRKFDAYLCYKVDSDEYYAEENILIGLHQNNEPTLKICIHRDHFQPGRTIKRNISEAIQDSNSAIIVMSQDFVNSVWCREEFADCYVENMNDPAFQMFVILTQPQGELQNLSEYMTSFLAQKTYLEKDDPNVIKKISEYLLHVKQD